MIKEQVDFTNDFEAYIRQGEPDKKEKGKIWQTAIGLQQVDSLKPSAYLIETAIQNIEGEITIDEVQYRIDSQVFGNRLEKWNRNSKCKKHPK